MQQKVTSKKLVKNKKVWRYSDHSLSGVLEFLVLGRGISLLLPFISNLLVSFIPQTRPAYIMLFKAWLEHFVLSLVSSGSEYVSKVSEHLSKQTYCIAKMFISEILFRGRGPDLAKELLPNTKFTGNLVPWLTSSHKMFCSGGLWTGLV